ncbi:MAG: type VI secretion system baseplate subunit TssG [Gemmatimonadota bacterium]
MAGKSRDAGTPLIKRLLRDPHRFDFFQAVRLLEWMQPDREPVGRGMAPGREAARFRSAASLEFAASDLVEIAPPRAQGDVPEMTVSFLGLNSPNGPLPRPFSELVIERVARKDPGMRDFLDIFHHRLISLLYRVRKRARVALHAGSPETAEVADRLFSMSGLGTPGLRNRLDVGDRALLRYTGLLAQRPRSMHGLERILTDYMGVPIRGAAFVGQWLTLDDDQQTNIGRAGRNAVLGQTAVLGGRVWDQQGKFELVVGPLTLREFTEFLPGADRLPKLVALTRFYVGPDLDFDVRLQLREDGVPAARLGADPGPRLGWTAWLRTSEFEGDPEVVIHNPERVVGSARALPGEGDAPVTAAPRRPSPEPASQTSARSAGRPNEPELVASIPV